jgi:hypothetical protein
MPIQEAQDVALVAGAQGGFHLPLSWRLSADAGADLTLTRTAERADGSGLVLQAENQVTLMPAGADGWMEAGTGSPLFMCPSPVGIAVVDVPVRVTLRLSDAVGRSVATGSATVVPRCPESNQAFCLRICTG